jgi:microcin C transport system substrate-binding protein
MIYRFFLILFLCTAPHLTQAQDLQYGLAMHGEPKYSANDTHLEYANPDAPKNGTLKQAAIGTFDTLNPFSIKGKAAQGLNMVYDRLMGRVWDEPFTMYPLIARGYTMPDDRSSITFYLNPKARFHDGAPIAVQDVVFSFETLRDHGRPNMRKVYRLVENHTLVDSDGIQFSFSEGYDRETALILAMMPVLSKSHWSARIENGESFDSTILESPNLNGPYRIKKFDTGRSIAYERVADYWAKDLLVNKGLHNFNTITFEYFRDDTVAFEAFKTGDIDIRREWNAGHWASNYDFPAIKDGTVIKDTLPHNRTERTRGMIFNTRRAPFDDIRVRQALSMTLDFDWINKNLFAGQYRQISSYFPNSELAATGAPPAEERAILEPFKTDLDKAIFDDITPPSPAPSLRENLKSADALLKDAGWDVVDGKRVKDGTAMTFEILITAPEDEKIALNFKRSLTRLGITPSIRVLDSTAYRDRLNVYDFDMTVYYWRSSLSPGTEQILYWGCDAAKQDARWNFAGMCHPAIDAIAGKVANTTSRTSLVNHMRALDRILLAGHYMIPLYYAGEDYVAYQSRIKHPDKTPLYGMVMETWWSEAEKTDDQAQKNKAATAARE